MSIVVWIEQFNGQAKAGSWEALGRARALADANTTSVAAIMLGKGVESLVKPASGYGADKVYLADDDSLAAFRVEPYAALVEKVITQENPSLVIFAATSRGRDLAAAVGAGLRLATAPDASSVEM